MLRDPLPLVALAAIGAFAACTSKDGNSVEGGTTASATGSVTAPAGNASTQASAIAGASSTAIIATTSNPTASSASHAPTTHSGPAGSVQPPLGSASVPSAGTSSQTPATSASVTGTPAPSGSATLPETDGGVAASASASAPVPLNCGTVTTLRQAADCTDRLIGVALAASHLGETDYAAAAREHNYVTAENEMKWGNIEPTRGSFSFGAADQIVNFAIQNDMQVKGHTLVWGEQLPSWVEGITSATELKKAMVDHINGVMNHYKGKVKSWDVVNEVFITTGRTGDGDPKLRDTVFARVIGPSYIDEAFIAARAADPDVLLIFNEFANEGLSDKSDAVYEMVKGMVDRGIPIDGVGMQMHVGVNTNPTVAEVTANMQRLAELGLKVFVSEMDVNGCFGYTQEEAATYYHDMVSVCVAQPACAGFTIWGTTDKYSWLNTNTDDSRCSGGDSPLPLLWNDNYGKKAAYHSVLDALVGK